MRNQSSRRLSDLLEITSPVIKGVITAPFTEYLYVCVTCNPLGALKSGHYDGSHFTMKKQAHGGRGTYKNNMVSKQIWILTHVCLTRKPLVSYDPVLSPGDLSPRVLAPRPELVPLALK